MSTEKGSAGNHHEKLKEYAVRLRLRPTRRSDTPVVYWSEIIINPR